MRNYNEPPEPIECNPENYDADNCRFCVNEQECKAEYEEHMKTLDARQAGKEQNERLQD